jgi:mRNA interferase YafQ
MYKIRTTNRFDKEVKLCIKRGYDISKLEEVVTLLEKTGTLPKKFKPHKLTGKYKDCWECHIIPNENIN